MASLARLLRGRKILDRVGPKAHKLDLQMVAGSQTRRHEAVDDDQVRIQVPDDVHDGSEDVDHLASGVGHDLGCIGTDSAPGFSKSRWSSEWLRDTSLILGAVEEFLDGLIHGDAVDLMIDDANWESIIVKAREGGEMEIQARISLEERLGSREEEIELATLDVGDEQDTTADEGSHREGLDSEWPASLGWMVGRRRRVGKIEVGWKWQEGKRFPSSSCCGSTW